MTNDTCICGAFEELCTIELENCADSQYRTLTRRKYDQKQLRVLKCKLYSKLFTHLCSPYVVSEQNFVTHISEDVYEIFDQFALEALYLKAAGEKKKGERLENLVKSLKETVGRMPTILF